MTVHRTLTLALAAFALPGLCACSEQTGSGSIVTESRDVGEFDAIEMEGAARVEVVLGQAASVEVEGREGVVERVETRVRGSTLHIESRPKDWFISDGRPRITLRISMRHLEALDLEGGNDVRLSGFEGGASRINVAGATHLKASGRLDELTVHMAGAGHADLSRLAAGRATVTLDGVGSVVVNPTDALDATMNGVGAIFYTGTPREVTTRMNGLGTIGRRDRHEEKKPRRRDERAPRYDEADADEEEAGELI